MPKRNPLSEARRSELIVLFLLLDKARSGYQIRSLIHEWQIDRYLPVSPTTIYRALDRLAGRGLLGTTSKRNGRFPVSTVYSITAKGRLHYRKLILEEAAFTRTSYSLTAFLGLAHYLPPDECERIAKSWQESARNRVTELNSRINDKTPGPGRTYGKAFAEWVLLDHERSMLNAEILWMDVFLGRLADRSHDTPSAAR